MDANAAQESDSPDRYNLQVDRRPYDEEPPTPLSPRYDGAFGRSSAEISAARHEPSRQGKRSQQAVLARQEQIDEADERALQERLNKLRARAGHPPLPFKQDKQQQQQQQQHEQQRQEEEQPQPEEQEEQEEHPGTHPSAKLGYASRAQTEVSISARPTSYDDSEASAPERVLSVIHGYGQLDYEPAPTMTMTMAPEPNRSAADSRRGRRHFSLLIP